MQKRLEVKATKIKRSSGDQFMLVIISILLFLIAVVTLWPFFDTLMTSISPTVDIMRNAKRIVRIPSYIDFSHYVYVFRGAQTMTSIRVSLLRTVVGTLVCLIMTALTAYPLSKRNLPGIKALTWVFLFTMLFQAGMIPTFLAVKNYRLTDTFWAFIFPEAISIYYMIIMRSFFRDLPNDLLEAAAIDGCSEIRTVYQIVLPLSAPVLASIGLFYAVWHWNAWFDAILYVSNRKLWPIQTLLREILLANTLTELDQFSMEGAVPPTNTVQAAVIMISVVPIACIYPFLQKHFVKGIMIGSIKG